MIKITTKSTFAEKQSCCGCGACANICPRGCIRMEADAEGFLYPSIDAGQCIECGLCEKACPIIQAEPDRPFFQKGYIVQNRDEDVRRQSTAGGAFTAIARHVLARGGVVFGAAYTDGFVVRHIGVDREEDLWRFRNSKYVQSRTAEAFAEAARLLREGRPVCFSGTPCQIEGLIRFLQAGMPADAPGLSGLMTVDVVCHAVPSPLVFEKYVRMQGARLGKKSRLPLGDILFRDKRYGYKYSTMTIRDRDGETLYARGIDTDPMLRAFFADVCDRPSCYACPFKKRYRMSDFTIWDCFIPYAFDKKMDDDRGTTRLLIHTRKGREAFAAIRKDLRSRAVDPDALTEGVREMFRSVDLSPRREAFMRDAARMPGQALFSKWFPVGPRARLHRLLRLLLVRTGGYATAKKLAYRLKTPSE